ncbi:thioesterase II family protein [Paenibacillus algicola]|uniref:thioesterase II family protein n=1 Tax=Paenibacillus algicola TaxID=2565926 RepID=UPI0010FCE0C1|nr:alpha/beta fold hydrolase [Paenibacillus algicola]
MNNTLAAGHPWIHIPEPRPHAQLRLVCLPYAGGNHLIYQHWPQKLSTQIEVLAVKLPGRGERFMEQPLVHLDEMIDRLLHEIMPYTDKPLALFGHSMGAMIAFELARKLSASRTGQLSHLFVSAFSAVHLPRPKKGRHLLSDEELKLELRQLNGTNEELLNHAELMELYMPVIRADLELCDTYQFRPGEPLDCGITAIGGRKDVGIHEDDLDAWRIHTSRGFELHMLQGDHFFLHPEADLLLRILEHSLGKQ